jgi:hypothetical protein
MMLPPPGYDFPHSHDLACASELSVTTHNLNPRDALDKESNNVYDVQV